jgi:1,4-alpha-glucan branching enzyme
MSITPPLLSMLRDPLLQERYDKHLAQLQKLAEREIERNLFNDHVRYLAEYYVKEFAEVRSIWESYDGDIDWRIEEISRQQ